MKHFGLELASSTSYLPYVKLDGKDGFVSRHFYVGTERASEIVENFTAIFDFETVQSGYICFGGDKPDMHLVPIGDPLPKCPSEDHKPGIQMVILLPKLGPHALATNAKGVIGAIGKLQDEVHAAPEHEKGQVPVVHLTGWQKEKSSRGTRAIPEFAIIGWKERPDALKQYKAEPKSRPSAPVASQPEKPPATGSSPLHPGPKPEPPTVDFDDFG